ncbi:MAG: hypothetical protein HY828_19695 [Actinobacteria bacterium]|nr:hypothetical protein [Actinomycetota bacterium]
MTAQTPGHRARVATGLVLGVTAVFVAAWGLRQWAPFQHPAAGADVFWPRNVAPLADFVEDHTGLHFLHPIEVEYIADPTAFAERTDTAPVLTDERREIAATDAALGRALGFWSGDVSLIDSSRTMREASDFGAVWLTDEHTIVVRADDGQSDLSPLDRAELVVLLSEILDDQHYDVAHRLDEAPPQEFQALLGLDLGQALWVRDQYVGTYSLEELEDYDAARDARGRAYGKAVADVPPVYRAIRVVAQTVGPGFVTALHSHGRRTVRDAFTDDTPTAIDQLSLPGAKYVRRDLTERVSPPPVPSAGVFVYDRQMGPFALFLVLASGTDAPTALTASDGWGNDSFSAYRLDGRVCVDGRVVADSAADADRIEPLLESWAAARPAEADALVGRDGTTLLLSVCDPGADIDQATPGQDVLDQYFGRASLLADRIELLGKPELAECVAASFYDRHVVADVRDDPSFDYVGELELITEDCGTSI